MPIPDRLYKYRAFDARTIELLVDDKVFFADPSTFNDPLDTRPTLVADLSSISELEEVLETLTTRRISAEMRAAARSIKYRGPRTMEHIERHTRMEAEKLLREIAYLATDPEYGDPPPAPQTRLLRQYIEVALLRQYEKGILSLASRFDCPLMWSHYGDQHRGLCIGYSVPPAVVKDIHEVDYSGGRSIQVSRVKAMLEGDEEARKDIDAGVLLRKAPDWKYEKEWRMLGPRGPADSSLELEEIVFGVRCLTSVRHAIVKALDGRDRAVKFFQMQEVEGRFELVRRELDDEDLRLQPRRALSIAESFADLTKESPAD